MGRITVFSLDECPHCRRAKAVLTERQIPFTEISLSSYPEKRSDMLSLADQLTVPQIFFNDIHMGGADDLTSLFQKWETDVHLTALIRYQKEIESQPDPADPRLDAPTGPPFVEEPPPPRNFEEESFELPGGAGEKVTVLQLTLTLMDAMPRYDLSYHGTTYKNSFRGSDGVDGLMKCFDFASKEDAVAFGRQLQKRKILHHVTDDDHTFGSNPYYFRLQPFHKVKTLNMFRIWTDRIDPDPVALVARLKKKLGVRVSRATDNEGKVSYLTAAKDADYWEFEEAVCELQGVNMADMDEKTKLAFGINLYNLMIIHAFVKVGIPVGAAQRNIFFGKVSYSVGGDILSFSALENGVLRANARAPYALSSPFSREDPRLRLVMTKADPRIHFGLNCGASSCPPIKKFTATAIDEELRVVAQSFCEQDDNVRIDEEAYEIHLNMILSWYSKDFAPSTAELPKKMIEYLRGEKKEILQRMIDNANKTIRVKFNTYDWSTNQSDSKPFDSTSLNKNEVSTKSVLKSLFCSESASADIGTSFTRSA